MQTLVANNNDATKARALTDAQCLILRDTIIRQLRREDRLLVILRYAERMTFQEIGLAVELPAAHVERRLTDIEHRLRAALHRGTAHAPDTA